MPGQANHRRSARVQSAARGRPRGRLARRGRARLATFRALGVEAEGVADMWKRIAASLAAASLGLFAAVPPADATPSAALSVRQLVNGSSSAVVNAGSSVTITTKVEGLGPNPATGVSVTEAVPAGFVVGGVDAPVGTYDGPTKTWTVGTLVSGESVTLTLVGTVGGSEASGSTTATASASNASSVVGDGGIDVNAAEAVTIVGYAGDLVSGPGTHQVTAGSDVTYQVKVSNNGGSPDTDVVVSDELPANFTLDDGSVTISAGSTGVAGGVLSWTIPSLAAGADATLTYSETTDAPSSLQANPNAVSVTSSATSAHGTSDPSATGDTWALDVLPAADLTVTDSDGQTSVVPGTSDTYTMEVENNGPSAVTGATLVDTLPTGFAVTGHTSSVAGTTFASPVSGEVEWTGVDLADGGTGTFTLSGDVDPTLGGGSAFVNVATVDLPPGETDSAATSTATDSDAGVPTADLTVKVTDAGSVDGTYDGTTNVTSGGSATPGDELDYTIVVANTSSQSTISQLNLSDLFPSAVVSTSWDVTNTVGGASATVSSGTGNLEDDLDLPPESSITFSVTGDVAAGASTPLVDTATLVPSSPLTDTGSFTAATDIVSLAPSADLEITDSDAVTSVTPGEADTYTIKVTDNGPSDVSGLGVTSPALPAGVTFTDLGGGEVVWTGLDVPSGGSLTLELKGTVDPSAPAGTGSFTDSVSLEVPAGVTDTAVSSVADDTDSVVPSATLAVSELADGASSPMAADGHQVVLTTTVSNSGPSEATGSSVSSLLPSGLLFGGSQAPAGTTYNPTTGTWSIGSLAPGESETLTCLAAVDTTASSVSVTAEATADDASPTSSTATVTVSSSSSTSAPADLSVEVTDNAGGAYDGTSNDTSGGSSEPGQVVDFTVSVVNHSTTTAADGVGLTDDLPAQVSSDTWSVTGTTGSATNSAGSSGTGNLSDSLDLPASSSITYTVDATTAAVANDVMVDTAGLSPPSTIDDTDAFTQSSDLVTLVPTADLSITVGDEVTTVTPGNADSYTVTVGDSGPLGLSGLEVLDTLPSGFEEVSSPSLPAGVTFTNLENGTVEWSGVSVAKGGETNLTLSGTLDPALAAGSHTFVETAQLVVPADDANSGVAASATDTDSVTPSASLTVTELADGASSEVVNDGQTVTFTTEVSNSGPSDATDVIVNDLLPAYLTLDGSVAPAGTTYDALTGVWAIGTLAPDESLTLTIVATVASSAATFTNSAVATAADASVVVSSATLTPNAAVEVTMTASPGDSAGPTTTGVARAGSDVTYEVTATNGGGGGATDVVVTDDLPAAFTLGTVTASAGVTHVSGSVLTWTLTTLAAGSDATLTYTETTDAPSAPATADDSASISSNESSFGDALAAETTAAWDVLVLPTADLTVTDSDGQSSVTPGTSDTYTVTVTNDGPSAVVDATVFDVLPTGLTVTGDTSSAGGTTFSDLGGGDAEWTGLDLANGATATFTLSGNVDPSLSEGAPFENEALVLLPAGTLLADPAEDLATDGDTVTPSAGVHVKVTDSGDVVAGTFASATNDTSGGVADAGSAALVYEVTVANGGPSTLSGLDVANLVPPGVTSDSWSSVLGGGATITGGGSSGVGDLDDVVTLPAGGSAAFTVDCDVSPGAFASLVDVALVQPPVGATDTGAFTSSTDLLHVISEPAATSRVSSTFVSFGAGGAVTDTVTVAGNDVDGSPVGSVAFRVCQTGTTQSFEPGPCPTTSTPEDPSEALGATTGDDSSATSVPFAPTSPGTWCFSVVVAPEGDLYQGTADNTTAGNADPNECVVVSNVQQTGTALSLSSGSVAYGSEQDEVFTVTVDGPSGIGAPLGTVEVAAGPQLLCSATLSPAPGPSRSSATCSPVATALGIGTYGDVVATYVPSVPSSPGGGFVYVGSSSAPASLTVTTLTAATTTELSLSSPSVAYGAEQNEHFSVTVSGGSGDGVPEGTVTVAGPSGTLCVADLAAAGSDVADGSCSLGSAELPAGPLGGFVATFDPGSPSSSATPQVGYAASSSAPANLSIGPATTATRLRAAPSLRWGSEGDHPFRVAVTAAGAEPSGTVRVMAGSRLLCVVTLSRQGAGSCSLRPHELVPGRYVLTARYVPAGADFRPSSAAPHLLVVEKRRHPHRHPV